MMKPERTLLWADSGLYSGFDAGGIMYIDVAVCERFTRDFNEWAMKRGCADELELEWDHANETVTLYEDGRATESDRPYEAAAGFRGLSIGYDLDLMLVDALEGVNDKGEKKLSDWVELELRSVERPNIAALYSEETLALLAAAGISESAVDFYLDDASAPGSGTLGNLPGLQKVWEPDGEIGDEMTMEL